LLKTRVALMVKSELVMVAAALGLSLRVGPETQ
jgi:hypothetical protein